MSDPARLPTNTPRCNGAVRRLPEYREAARNDPICGRGSIILLYNSYRRRVVIPLVRSSSLDRSAAFVDAPLNPVFTVKGIKVVLHPLEVVSVAIDQLGDKVASLAQEGGLITGAMDEMLTRAWA